jgi:hypothetical protein
MLAPVDPLSVTPHAYLSPVSFSKKSSPDLEKLQNRELAIELIYPKPVKTDINFGVGPTAAFGEKIILSGFIVPLSGELINVKKAWGKEIYTYTHLFIFSNFDEPIVATTRTPQRIKNILTHKFGIPIP